MSFEILIYLRYIYIYILVLCLRKAFYCIPKYKKIPIPVNWSSTASFHRQDDDIRHLVTQLGFDFRIWEVFAFKKMQWDKQKYQIYVLFWLRSSLVWSYKAILLTNNLFIRDFVGLCKIFKFKWVCWCSGKGLRNGAYWYTMDLVYISCLPILM